MWEVMGTREATFYFDNFANFLDQLLVNKNMLSATSPIHVVPGTVEIIRLPGMFDPAATYQAPIPFGGMGKPANPSGFSDHFPIGVQVEEAD
jgi:hypothetical protein